MMVLDTSAVMAVLLSEPECEVFLDQMEQAERCFLSVANVLEAHMVMQKRVPQGAHRLDNFLQAADIRVQPVDIEQLLIARRAFDLYGKSNHKAALNFGDCFSYALAKSRSLPMLFKGNDFIHTDITPAFNLH